MLEFNFQRENGGDFRWLLQRRIKGEDFSLPVFEVMAIAAGLHSLEDCLHQAYSIRGGFAKHEMNFLCNTLDEIYAATSRTLSNVCFQVMELNNKLRWQIKREDGVIIGKSAMSFDDMEACQENIKEVQGENHYAIEVTPFTLANKYARASNN